MSWLREPDTEPIPGYKLVEPLGTGGFGEVWKCIAPGGIYKAIKFVYGNLDAADGDAAKAQQEYSALERVKAVRHPFVLSMDRIEVVDGEVVIVMELADKSLYDLQLEYQTTGRPGIPRNLLLGFLSDAAEGLDHLIEKYNLLHLDVKPKNLFLIADRVKVADFGLVKHLERHSQSGVLAGITPVYAAPETFSNKISKHSDQYSLAIVYTDLLTGQRVFNGKNIRQLAVQHLTAVPDLSLVPEGDRPAVARALSKNPDERFDSCSAFIRALMATPSVAGTPTRTQYDVPGFRKASVAEFDFSELGKTNVIGPTDVTPRPGFRPKNSFDSITLSGVTASRVEPAALRPALMIGVGTFGRRALQHVRGRLLDRLGDLRHVPCVRFLYLDPDSDAPKKAARAAADVAMTDDQIITTPLQPVTNYRRKHLDHLTEWLPLEKLYTIPRSLSVDGSRALGRLAFSDHFLRVTARLRHELETVSRPEMLARASTATGLSARDKTPVVYVFISASGGTGGMLLDLGHAIKKALERLNLSAAPVVSFVYVGAPHDTGTPAAEQANVYATIAELNHFADEEFGFTAGYAGPEGPRVDARGLPFTATYLMTINDRSSTAFRDCLAHLAGYVTHDLTTPLGTLLERVRTSPPVNGRVPFRGFGTFGVWYPRGLVLRAAARRLCGRVIQSWLACDKSTVPESANALVEHVLADPRLDPDAIMRAIVNESADGPLGNPEEFVTRWVRNVGDVATTPGPGRPDPALAAAATWDQCREIVGFEPTSESDSPFRRAKFGKALDTGVKRAVENWKTELTKAARAVEDLPGVGLAGVQAVCSLLVDACKVTLANLEARADALAANRLTAYHAAGAALAEWPQSAGGFSLFGNRAAK
ncbi:MAG TPA: tubulin-like doman-containing protein, partial [Fimbriiglobus sp.]